jgi:Endoribonuclease L-PSP
LRNSRIATLSWAPDWTPLFIRTEMDGFVNDIETDRRRGLHARASDGRGEPAAASYQEEELMAKRVLRPPNLTFLPRPEYPYSPGSTGGGLVYTAGQVAWDDNGELVGSGNPAAQTRQVLANVLSVLREAVPR